MLQHTKLLYILPKVKHFIPYLFLYIPNDHTQLKFFLEITFIVVVVGVLATEIVYAIKARKGNEVSKVFNIITMVLNAVFAVLCLLISILMFVEIGAMAFEEFLFYCPYYFVFLWGAASFGTAFGFRLYAMLKK